MWVKLHWYCITVLYSLLLALPVAHSRSFPATSDPTLADQQRWGAFTRGYVTDGCWHGTAAALHVNVASCRAFVLDQTDPEKLVGVEETIPSTLNYPPGDGTTWLGVRANPSAVMPGWTCQSGLPYCLLTQATPPEVPSGMLLIGKTTVAGGAITQFTIMAPWRRTTPFPVPSGTTLTFGVCPVAGRVPIFQALNDASSGRVAFTAFACEEVYPEWWGADATGTSDATAVWRAVLAAAKPATPVSCAGDYLISATVGTTALTLTGNEQIIGKLRQNHPQAPATVLPCRFTFTGAGNALGTLNDVLVKHNIWLQNLYIWDKDRTGNRGLDLWAMRAGGIRDVVVEGFHTGMWLGQLFYYARIENLFFHESRHFCADMSGGSFNGPTIDLTCNTTSLDLEAGVRIGVAAGLYGTGNALTLRGTIETFAGRALEISGQRNLSVHAYIETYGVAANHDTVCVVCFNRIEGATIDLSLSWSGGAADPLPVGLRVTAVGAGSVHSHHLTLRGFIDDGFTLPYRVDFDEGAWAIDTSGLAVDNDTLGAWGAFAGGFKLSNNLITSGGIPLVDQGRGSTFEASVWRAGDVIWGATPGGPLQNVLRIVNADGNPPATGGISSFMLQSINPLTVLAAETTPSVKTGQIYNTKFSLDAGSAITDFIDDLAGMCITLRALGARTITSGAAIALPTGSFAMTTGDTLTLCSDSGVWREYGRADYP